jgi:hypothetical protein
MRRMKLTIIAAITVEAMAWLKASPPSMQKGKPLRAASL